MHVTYDVIHFTAGETVVNSWSESVWVWRFGATIYEGAASLKYYLIQLKKINRIVCNT